MTNHKARRSVMHAAAATGLLLSASAAMAGACRVSDFTDRPLGSLNEVERLSFVLGMTRTEYDRLKAEPATSANHYELLARSPSLPDARQAARDRLESLKVENIEEYARLWAHDYLTDEQIQKLANCESGRQPGLATYGRPEGADAFHLTYVHVTPIGIEKITTRVVASANIANIGEFEASLAELGPRDNYTARTFVLRRIDPAKPAVLVMRAGWETPKFTYIPVYPTPDYFK